MKTNVGLVTGLIIIVVVVGFYGYLTWDALQTPPVDSSQVAVAVPTLDTKALEDIRNKNINGNLPIKLAPDGSDLDNPTPFLTR